MMERLLRILLGTPSLRAAGFGRTLRGLRTNNRTELLFGIALTAYSVVHNNRSGRDLLFSKKIPTGSAIVIHHKRRGDPSIEVIKPGSSQTL